MKHNRYFKNIFHTKLNSSLKLLNIILIQMNFHFYYLLVVYKINQILKILWNATFLTIILQCAVIIRLLYPLLMLYTQDKP